MIITCPQCDTSFTLPDELFLPGRKARCSNCKSIFIMTEPLPDVPMPDVPIPDLPRREAARRTPPEPTAPPPMGELKAKRLKKSRKLFFIMLAAIFVSLAGISYGSLVLYRIFMAPDQPQTSDTTASSTAPSVTPSVDEKMSELERARLEELEKSVALITMEDVRQYYVKNDTLGDLVIVQGQVVNGFATPKELLAVEVLLYDEHGNVLASKPQVAGVMLTPMQLQVMTESELTDALNSKVDIFLKNTNVQPRGRVPFMAFFAHIPESFYEFEVRPIAAKDPARE